MRQRAARKKRPKETPESLLEGFDVYTSRSLQHLNEHDNRKSQSIASKALGVYCITLYIKYNTEAPKLNPLPDNKF